MRPTRQQHLSAVRVAREHERHIELGGLRSRRGSCASRIVVGPASLSAPAMTCDAGASRSGCRRSPRVSLRIADGRPLILQDGEALRASAAGMSRSSSWLPSTANDAVRAPASGASSSATGST